MNSKLQCGDHNGLTVLLNNVVVLISTARFFCDSNFPLWFAFSSQDYI